MQPVAVLNIVGLSENLLDHAPNIKKYISKVGHITLDPGLPAVTCPVQASMLTGENSSSHGIVANGWYERNKSEINFWKQSNWLVEGPKIWDQMKSLDSKFTVANLFWWFNMYGSLDIQVTPRPCYRSNGRKIPDIHTKPSSLRDELQSELGQFPLFNFWGPKSNIFSSKWIKDATKKIVSKYDPTLTLVYLPHLDYPLQRVGPNHSSIPTEVASIDNVTGDLIDYFTERGRKIILLSEYGITETTNGIAPNHALKNAGMLEIREEENEEHLDAGASDAFAVADHQIAHIYIKDKKNIQKTYEILNSLDGIDRILQEEEMIKLGIKHQRSGDLLAISNSDRWFQYDWWATDSTAPDYAKTIDIHKKPGYDPRELHTGISATGIGWKLLKIKMGLRTMLDIIPLDPKVVKGSHGRQHSLARPLCAAPGIENFNSPIKATQIKSLIKQLHTDTNL